MKLKLMSALTFALLFMTLSCAEFDDQLGVEPTLPPPPQQEYTSPLTGGPMPTQLNVTNYNTLSTALASSVNTINSNPSMYWATMSNGTKYTDFSVTSSWPAQSAYIKRIHMLEQPSNFVPMNPVDFKAYIASEIPKLEMSSSFNTQVNSFVNWIYNVDNIPWTTDYSTTRPVPGFLDQAHSRMTSITLSTGLSAFEKFVLTQMYNGIILHTTHAYNNASSADCLPSTKEEWRAVATSAGLTGLSWGANWGLRGARAGIIATAPAGNPIAGVIVGGGIGFIMGFVAGAYLGGGGRIMIECILDKVAGEMMTFDCGGRTYTAYTASAPTGCTAITQQMTAVPQALKVTLTSIYELGVVPNRGESAIPSSVTTAINDFLKYLNQ